MPKLGLYHDADPIVLTSASGALTRSATGKLHVRKDNLSASAAPTVNADSSAGYEVGSLWLDLTGGNYYVCKSADAGAASWMATVQAPLTPGGSDTQIQYNSSGSFAGSSNLTWSSSSLGVTGSVAVTSGATGSVPLSITAASGQTANLLNVTPYGGTAGDLFKIDANGVVTVQARSGGNTAAGFIIKPNAVTSPTKGLQFVAVGPWSQPAIYNTSHGPSDGGYIAFGNFISLGRANTEYIQIGGDTTVTVKSPLVVINGQVAGVALSVTGANGQIANLLNITTYGGTAGDRFKVAADGAVSVVGKLTVTLTTEQLRLGYDGSNYFSTTVGSAGGVTFDAVGTGAGFTFSDPIYWPGESEATNRTIVSITNAWGNVFAIDGKSGAIRMGNTTSTASGDGQCALALGKDSAATGQYSFAMRGSASGGHSIAIGPYSSSTGTRSIAIGAAGVSPCQATADYALAIGQIGVNATYSTGIGYGSTAARYVLATADAFAVAHTSGIALLIDNSRNARFYGALTADGCLYANGDISVHGGRFEMHAAGGGGSCEITYGGGALSKLRFAANNSTTVPAFKIGTSLLEIKDCGDTLYMPVAMGNLTVNGLASVVSTTGPQLQVKYDTSNYLSTTVASNGYVTFSSVGTVPGFKFAGNVRVDGQPTIVEGGATPMFLTIFEGGDQSGNITYTLPTAQAGGSGYLLANNGSGVLSWVPLPSGSQWTTSGSDISFTTGKVGIGASSMSARLHVVATTEQLRIGYDAATYTNFVVASTGRFDITSASATAYAAHIYLNPGSNSVYISGTSTARLNILDTPGSQSWGEYSGDRWVLVSGLATAHSVNCTTGVVFNEMGANLDFRIEGDTNVNLFCVDASADMIGIGLIDPAAILHIQKTSEQLRLGYNASNYTSFTTNSGGDLAIAPSGGNLTVTAADVDIASDKAFYLGNPTTDGSWKIIRSGNNLLMQRREAGSYVTKTTITA